MLKAVTIILAASLSSVAIAHSEPSDRPVRSHIAAPPEAATAPVSPDPEVVQKWFGSAVDDILTNAGRTLNGRPAAKDR